MSQLPSEGKNMLSNLADALDGSERAPGLIAGFAHDLKVPISTIVASAELLEEELDVNMSSHLLGVIERQTQRLHLIVQDLSDYFGVGSDSLLIHPATVDLGELVRETCFDFQTATPSHQLVVRLPASKVHIQGDNSKIRRVLENL